jgi:hypothetical protein
MESRKHGQSVEVFFSYAHKDKHILERMEKHLAALIRQGAVSAWHDRMIGPGREWAGQIDERINTAKVILLLVSADFIASDYCYDIEMLRAMERHEASEAHVIPVIVRPCDWQAAPFGKLQALPEGAKPITLWANRDAAFTSIAKEIRSLIEDDLVVGDTEPAGHFKRDIPDILPYLCNRVDQEEELAATFPVGDVGPNRPFVCVVHGDRDECHDMYKSRLQQYSLPKLIRGGSAGELPFREFFLPFPISVRNAEQGFNRLRGTLAEKVADRRQASNEEIAKALSRFRTPVMLYSYLSAEMWGRTAPTCSTRS